LPRSEAGVWGIGANLTRKRGLCPRFPLLVVILVVISVSVSLFLSACPVIGYHKESWAGV
jgi:hypothetical protein